MLTFVMHDLEEKSLGSQSLATYTTPGLSCAPGIGNLDTLERSYGGLLSLGIVVSTFVHKTWNGSRIEELSNRR
jgi:hypothetical protein